MGNIDVTIILETLKQIGFVPSILIVGGWFYALILGLICLYNLSLYVIGLLIYRKMKNGN